MQGGVRKCNVRRRKTECQAEGTVAHLARIAAAQLRRRRRLRRQVVLRCRRAAGSIAAVGQLRRDPFAAHLVRVRVRVRARVRVKVRVDLN